MEWLELLPLEPSCCVAKPVEVEAALDPVASPTPDLEEFLVDVMMAVQGSWTCPSLEL
jgi:hypothetical protein